MRRRLHARALGAPAGLMLAGLTIAGLMIAAGVSCNRGDEPTGSAGRASFPAPGEAVRVGYANEAPFAYVDPATGTLTGEAPEVARVVLSRLGYDEVTGVLTEFGSLIPGLLAGRFDLIAAGMYVTPARCRQVAFSEPSYGLGGAFLVASGNPKDLHGYDDVLADESVRLGVMAGAVESGYARSVGIPDARLVFFPDGPSALAGVLAGRVDAYAGTALTVTDLLSKVDAATLERATPFEDPVIDGRPARGYGAFAFRPADAAVRDRFDGELAEFLGTESHAELVRPFGFTATELPGDVRREALCAGT